MLFFVDNEFTSKFFIFVTLETNSNVGNLEKRAKNLNSRQNLEYLH